MSSTTIIAALYVFALAAFLGYQVISRVPPLLHTPLMSATNAISGISLVGSIVIAGGTTGTGAVSTVYAVDPHTGGVSSLGHLPAPVAHASALAIGGTVYIFGGRYFVRGLMAGSVKG